ALSAVLPTITFWNGDAAVAIWSRRTVAPSTALSTISRRARRTLLRIFLSLSVTGCRARRTTCSPRQQDRASVIRDLGSYKARAATFCGRTARHIDPHARAVTPTSRALELGALAAVAAFYASSTAYVKDNGRPRPAP